MKREGFGPKEQKIIQGLLNSIIKIEGGVFKMGDDGLNVLYENCPLHEVEVNSFEFMSTPVTQAQYEAVMGVNPSEFKGLNNPVENVKWQDAIEFCEKLSERTGKKFRLPTEAEWEYACRAGKEARYFFGNKEAKLRKYAWYWENSEKKTHPVGTKKPNRWGLYDMLGNVWEWCSDWWDRDYYKSSPGAKYFKNTPKQNPKGPPTGDDKVRRGGCSFSFPEALHVAFRDGGYAASNEENVGFRCIREL